MMLIVDGNNICFRALHTMHLSFLGRDTSITYGVLMMLNSMIRDKSPSSVVVCFDGGTPPFRKKLIPQYKAHRIRNDEIDWDDAFRQIDELCYVSLPAHGVLTIRKRHCEADDLIAQAARIALDHTVIVSSDDDLMQCVNERTHVYNPTKLMHYTLDNVLHKTVDHVLYKVLCGDLSDNVPGVRNIGEKTAEKMIDYLKRKNVLDYSYGNLIEMLDDLPLDKRQRASFQALGEEQWNALWDVIDLWYDRCGARMAVLSARWKPLDVEKVKRYYFANGFVSLLEDNAISLFQKLEEPQFERDVRMPAPSVERSCK